MNGKVTSFVVPCSVLGFTGGANNSVPDEICFIGHQDARFIAQLQLDIVQNVLSLCEGTLVVNGKNHQESIRTVCRELVLQGHLPVLVVNKYQSGLDSVHRYAHLLAHTVLWKEK